jgi:hypothetical protein
MGRLRLHGNHPLTRKRGQHAEVGQDATDVWCENLGRDRNEEHAEVETAEEDANTSATVLIGQA